MTRSVWPDPSADLSAAVALHQAGRTAEAEAIYLRLALGPDPFRAQSLQLLGLLYRQTAQTAQALAVYDRLIELGVVVADGDLIRGDLYLGLGRPAEALACYDLALAADPQRADIHNNCGVALEALGRPAQALERFDASVALRPQDANAHFNRAGVLSALDRPSEALAAYDQALALRPNHAQTHNNRALSLGALKRWDEALAGFDAAIRIAPAYAEAFANRSIALRQLKRLADALSSAEHALSLRPDYPEALTTRGLALAALGRFEEALQSHEAALALRPAYPEALNNAALSLEGLGRFEAAADRLEAALELNPAFADAEFNSALALLRLGRFEIGWRRHEARFRRPGRPGPTYTDAHLWLGQTPLKGKTILLHAEQGLGDTIQFCRYAASVKALGARVLLEVQPPLVRLLRELEGVDELYPVGAPVPPFDLHCPLMSLPLALGFSTDVGPSPPYLTAEPDRVSAWRAELGEPPGRRIGLVWSGNPAHENDFNRSIPLETLAPLLAASPNTFISLQKDIRASDAAWRAQLPQVVWAGERLMDFADTAALISACDLIISVDTAVTHLAGALGKPVLLLLPRPADWRWGVEGEATPWYLTLRLLRQDRPGDWAGVMTRLSACLENPEPAVAGLT